MSNWYDPFGLFTDSYEDPSKKALPYLQQIPDAIKPYYQPYMDAGTSSLATLQDQYNMLLNDPTIMMNKIGNSYTASPGYQYNVNQATNAANNAAAADGYLGSPAEQENLASQIAGISSQDYNTYMQQALAQYGLGLQGTSDLNTMGYKANTGYAGELSDVLNSEANLSYAGTQGKNANDAAKMNNWLKLAGMGLGYKMGSPAVAIGKI